MDEAVLAWLSNQRSLRAPSDRRDHLRRFTKRFEGKPLTAITRPVLEQLVRLRANENAGTKHAKRPPQPATVNRCLATICAILDHAQGRGWIASVPRVRKLVESEKRIRKNAYARARIQSDRACGREPVTRKLPGQRSAQREAPKWSLSRIAWEMWGG